jgi:hypothetical protein
MNHKKSAADSHGYLFVCAVTAALAGFLFGFDTIVISGAEEKIQSIWLLDGFMHGLCMSAALWGTVLGAMFGGWPTERFGRRKTLRWIGVLYFVSALGSGLAPSHTSTQRERVVRELPCSRCGLGFRDSHMEFNKDNCSTESIPCGPGSFSQSATNGWPQARRLLLKQTSSWPTSS